MMKTKKVNKLILLLLVLCTVFSCVEDDDFSIPDTTITEPNIADNLKVSISSLAGELSQAQDNDPNPMTLDYTDDDTTYTFDFEGQPSTHVQGYVISSDKAGNFFEEILLQDNFENPTIGIKVRLNVNPLFTRYELGRKLFIKLDGLSVGITNGVLTLGILNGTEIDQIAAPLELDFIQRSSEVATLTPLPVDFNTLADNMTNLYVTVEDAQFSRNQVLTDPIMTFASEELDEFDGERVLENCADSSTIVFSTSTFADFKGLPLPVDRGSINGILTKNFFGDTFNFVVNSATDINFDNTDRCDPIEIDCGLAAAQGTNNLFMDDFETQTPFSLISGNGWTNYIQEGSEGWEAYTSGGANSSLGVSCRMSAFGTGDNSNIAWLITPAIDLDAQDGETLVFQTSNSFSDDSNLELLFSPDWDGTEANIATATWGILPQAYIVQDDDFFGDWFGSGTVDLSCAAGTIYIAFKYTGNDVGGNNNGTYELDEISIDYN